MAKIPSIIKITRITAIIMHDVQHVLLLLEVLTLLTVGATVAYSTDGCSTFGGGIVASGCTGITNGAC